MYTLVSRRGCWIQKNICRKKVITIRENRDGTNVFFKIEKRYGRSR